MVLKHSTCVTSCVLILKPHLEASFFPRRFLSLIGAPIIDPFLALAARGSALRPYVFSLETGKLGISGCYWLKPSLPAPDWLWQVTSARVNQLEARAPGRK